MPLEQQPDAKGRPSSSNAAAPLLFETLDVAHQSHGRVRYRYTLPKGSAKLAPQALERVVRDQPGVTGVRLNPAARSIAIQFDGKKTSIPKLQRVLSHIPASVCTGASGAAVLAPTRCDEEPVEGAETLLCVANLSATPRSVTIEVPELAGRGTTDLFGGCAFPPAHDRGRPPPPAPPPPCRACAPRREPRTSYRRQASSSSSVPEQNAP